MRAKLYIHAIGIWSLFVIFSLFNSIIRYIFLEPFLGEYPGHIISVCCLAAFVLIVTYFFIRNTRFHWPAVDLFLVGFMWVIISIVFEFGFGHYVMGDTWAWMIANYDVARGRLWVLILVCELLAPAIFSLTVKRRHTKKSVPVREESYSVKVHH
jgi:hypothetical protein